MSGCVVSGSDGDDAGQANCSGEHALADPPDQALRGAASADG
jgi:hypothetical protein